MGKVSSYTYDTSPTTTDYFLGNSASGPSTFKFRVSDVINADVFTSPCKFSVYRAAAQTPGSNGVIQYDTKSFDTGNNLDIVTNKGRFTAPISGYYVFSVDSHQTVSTAPQDPQVMLWKNGSIEIGYSHFVNMYNGTSGGSANAFAFVHLNASDYVEAVIGLSIPLDISSPARNCFSGFLYAVA